MVYEDEEPDARDPNYDESAQVRRSVEQTCCSHKPAALPLFRKCLHYRSSAESVGRCVVQAAFFVPERPRPTKPWGSGWLQRPCYSSNAAPG